MTSAPALGSALDLGDLPTAELMTQGRAALEWIARYLDHPERVSVLSQVVPGDIRASLPASPPDERRVARATSSRDFESKIIPGITHWNHPGVLRLLRDVVVGAGHSRRAARPRRST